jgi:hypothetical protein
MQMCPEAAKFRIAPLQDEEDLKVIFDKNAVTNVTARVPPSSQAVSQGKKNKRCPYSPSPAGTPKMSTGSVSRFDRVMELMEKKEARRSSLHACVYITSFVIVSYLMTILTGLSVPLMSMRRAHLLLVDTLRLLQMPLWVHYAKPLPKVWLLKKLLLLL